MTVSILMPAYNVAPFITRAIDSVVRQTHQDWELIVVNDFSSDNTDDVVSDLASREPRIRLVRMPANMGPGAARNAALAEATGQWIAVLDSDDAWKPRRLEILLDWADRTSAEFVADNLLRYDLTLDTVLGPAGRFHSPFEPLDLKGFFDNKSRGKPLGYGLLKPLIDHAFLKRHDLRYRPDLRFGEDFRFYVDIFASSARGILLSEAHYIYTMPTGPRSKAPSTASRTQRREEITLSVMDDIIHDYADKADPEVRASILDCRQRVLDGVLVAQLRASKFRTGRLGEFLFLMRHPRIALARLRRLFYAFRSSMP